MEELMVTSTCKFVFTCSEKSRYTDDNYSPFILAVEAFRAQESMATLVVEATEFDSQVVCDLRGHLEAQNDQKLNRMITP